LAGVPFVVVFGARPVSFRVGVSSITAFEYEVERVASLPEALFAELLIKGLDRMRVGVSSFRRFEERGVSSMAVMEAGNVPGKSCLWVDHGKCGIARITERGRG
jgi:hypothetical protein